eukprot:7370018-Alexandrium_andersonii.AAC.1
MVSANVLWQMPAMQFTADRKMQEWAMAGETCTAPSKLLQDVAPDLAAQYLSACQSMVACVVGVGAYRTTVAEDTAPAAWLETSGDPASTRALFCLGQAGLAVREGAMSSFWVLAPKSTDALLRELRLEC